MDPHGNEQEMTVHSQTFALALVSSQSKWGPAWYEELPEEEDEASD